MGKQPLKHIPHTPTGGPGSPIGPYTIHHPPNLDYITASEQVCHKLNPQEAEELRTNIQQASKKFSSIKPNICKIKYKATQELKIDKIRLSLQWTMG